MSNFNYLLSYNPFALDYKLPQLHVFVTQNRDISQWYAPFSGTYILKSPAHLAHLNDQFSQFFGSSPYLLTWLAPGHSSGSLPAGIWEWVNGVPNPFLPKK